MGWPDGLARWVGLTAWLMRSASVWFGLTGYARSATDGIGQSLFDRPETSRPSTVDGTGRFAVGDRSAQRLDFLPETLVAIVRLDLG
jgi:hypothetical protein